MVAAVEIPVLCVIASREKFNLATGVAVPDYFIKSDLNVIINADGGGNRLVRLKPPTSESRDVYKETKVLEITEIGAELGK